MGNSVVHSAGKWLMLALLVALISRPVAAQSGSESPKLQVGQEAPEFKLQYFDGNGLKDVHLSDYRGKKNVVLAFYVFAFTGG
jgi:AhpC/TSA family